MPRESGYVEIKPKKSPPAQQTKKSASEAGGKKWQFYFCSEESVSRREGPHSSMSADERMSRWGQRSHLRI